MWISIEGNIGSGKTTAFEALQQSQLEWIFANEPVQDWVRPQDKLGKKSMLQLFQEDTEKHGPFFQTQALSTRLAILNPLMNLRTSKTIVSERSPESDFEVFAPLMKMTLFEKACQESIQECLSKSIPDLVIYIRSRPETCLKRIGHRGRSSEKNVSISYLERLHEQHEMQIKSLQVSKRPFAIVNGDESKEEVLQNILQAIRHFVLQHGVVP